MAQVSIKETQLYVKQLGISSSQFKLLNDFQNSITVEMAPTEAAGCFAVLCQKHYNMGPALIYLVSDDEALIEAVTVDESGNAETILIDIDQESTPIPQEIQPPEMVSVG